MIVFPVLGTPAPQGSKSAVVRGGHAVLIEGSSTVGREKHQAWRDSVGWAAADARVKHGPIDDDTPVAATIWFYLPKPKSRPKKAIWADRKPDLDKLIRSTLDGLGDGGLLKHDSRVVTVTASKAYATAATGAVIHLSLQPGQTPLIPREMFAPFERSSP